MVNFCSVVYGVLINALKQLLKCSGLRSILVTLRFGRKMGMSSEVFDGC